MRKASPSINLAKLGPLSRTDLTVEQILAEVAAARERVSNYSAPEREQLLLEARRMIHGTKKKAVCRS